MEAVLPRRPVAFRDIENVGLYRTQNLTALALSEKTRLTAAICTFAQSNIVLSDALSLSLGGRYDYLDVDVTSSLGANSGSESDGLFTLKQA